FAGGAFEDVHIKTMNGSSDDNNKAITLTQYAERLNVQLLRASNFNEKLRDREAPKDVTVQKICKAARDERDVRRMLDAIWDKPEEAKNALNNAIKANDSVYKFEEELEAATSDKEEGKGEEEKGEVAPTTGPPSTAAAEV